MKTRRKMLMWLALPALLAACSGLKTTGYTAGEVAMKIESGEYEVEVQYADPMRGRRIYLNHAYSLTIRNDSAFAYLPYFGVARSAPYGGDGGIKFAEPLQAYSMIPNRKQNGWDIRFKIQAEIDAYDVFLTVFDSGSATVSFQPQRRDPISFSGQLGSTGRD